MNRNVDNTINILISQCLQNLPTNITFTTNKIIFLKSAKTLEKLFLFVYGLYIFIKIYFYFNVNTAGTKNICCYHNIELLIANVYSFGNN